MAFIEEHPTVVVVMVTVVVVAVTRRRGFDGVVERYALSYVGRLTSTTTPDGDQSRHDDEQDGSDTRHHYEPDLTMERSTSGRSRRS